ncbi:hypothetical protein [Nitrosomonas halophila]|uniref:hypothetical protein n=1 Tax=Nitrosomonas halophila TaxID=44576 RepID=UPI0015A1C791|nr:hypothetical protein [Nitrosomonas halophila]
MAERSDIKKKLSDNGVLAKQAGDIFPDKQAARLQNLEYYPIIHPDEIWGWSPITTIITHKNPAGNFVLNADADTLYTVSCLVVNAADWCNGC